MANEINTKRQLNFGFMLDNQNKRKGGFLIDTDDTSVPADFDRMFEYEIAEMFYGEDIETLNKLFEKMAK